MIFIKFDLVVLNYYCHFYLNFYLSYLILILIILTFINSHLLIHFLQSLIFLLFHLIHPNTLFILVILIPIKQSSHSALFAFQFPLTIIFLITYELTINPAFEDLKSLKSLTVAQLLFENLKKFQFNNHLYLLQNQALIHFIFYVIVQEFNFTIITNFLIIDLTVLIIILIITNHYQN